MSYFWLACWWSNCLLMYHFIGIYMLLQISFLESLRTGMVQAAGIQSCQSGCGAGHQAQERLRSYFVMWWKVCKAMKSTVIFYRVLNSNLKFIVLCKILIKKYNFLSFRFAGESSLRQLPVWVRPHVNKYDVFGRAIRDMIIFFKTAEQTVSFILINVYF